MTKWWLVWRYLGSRNKLLSLTSILSIIGFSVGVAALVVSMAIISGFEATLKQSVIDIFGDVVVVKLIKSPEHLLKVKSEIQQVIDEENSRKEQDLWDFSGSTRLLSVTPYITAEGVVVHNKKVSGVILQGLESSSYSNVLNLESRIVKGSIDLSMNGLISGVAVGEKMAEKFNLSIGDTFKVVVPIADGYESFNSKLKIVRVTGILGLGLYEYDLRTILMDLSSLQDFIGLGQQVSGVRLNIEESNHAMTLSHAISSQLSEKGYWAMNWRQVNHNLFTAIGYEQFIIFFLLMIIIVAASFNVASTLFVSVLNRSRDISILQAIGMTRSSVRSLFVIQGLITGLIGYVCGLILGWGMSWAFVYGYKKFGLLSGEVYKLSGLSLSIRPLDLIIILFSSLAICYLATLSPSAKGRDLPLINGLKYE